MSNRLPYEAPIRRERPWIWRGRDSELIFKSRNVSEKDFSSIFWQIIQPEFLMFHNIYMVRCTSRLQLFLEISPSKLKVGKFELLVLLCFKWFISYTRNVWLDSGSEHNLEKNGQLTLWRRPYWRVRTSAWADCPRTTEDNRSWKWFHMRFISQWKCY